MDLIRVGNGLKSSHSEHQEEASRKWVESALSHNLQSPTDSLRKRNFDRERQVQP